MLAQIFTPRLVAKALVLLLISTMINLYLVSKLMDDYYPSMKNTKTNFKMTNENLYAMNERIKALEEKKG